MSDRLLDTYDALLLDLDGTVFRGSEVIPGAAEALSRARAEAVTVRFVTNNASRTPEQVAEHLTGLGVTASAGEVSTSGQAAASVLAERLPAGVDVLVVGSPALDAEVVKAGFTPVRTAGADTAAVVQGMNPATNWADLAEACVAIRAGALWVACNVDLTLPSERGLLPGNGALVAALTAATGLHPVVAGKPATPLMAESMRSAAANRPLVVGDRLNTDIEGARAAGLDSLLVLTGVATPAELLAADPQRRPTYLAADISALTSSVPDLAIGPRPGWSVEDGLAVRSTGGTDPLDLLRTLCAAHWAAGGGPATVAARDDHTRGALATLGLAG